EAQPKTAAAADAKPRAPATATPGDRPAPPRRDDRGPTREADAPHRHKGKVHGSHRMPSADEGVEDANAPRYFGNELHLSQEGAARRTGRKKPRSRPAEPARSGPAHAFSRPTTPQSREVSVGDSITVAELANKMAVKG